MEKIDELEEYKSVNSPIPFINIKHAKSQNNFYSSKGMTVPSFDEIARLSGNILQSKKPCHETFPPPPEVKSQREVKLPRIQLLNSKKGINQPCWFPQSNEVPHDSGANRFTARPHEFVNSSTKIFPTLSLKFYQMPTTTSERFSEVDAKKDVQLANYAFSSTNAFRTEWLKYKDLKNRKLYPERHPEFTGITKENNMKKDKIVDYREAMLKVKAMMNQAWGVKK